MIRFELVLSLMLIGANCSAVEKEKTAAPQMAEATEVSAAADASVAPNELVVHHHDLATHLGLKSQDVIFTTPRNFRSRTLNEMGLDDAKSGDSIEAIDPLTDNR